MGRVKPKPKAAARAKPKAKAAKVAKAKPAKKAAKAAKARPATKLPPAPPPKPIAPPPEPARRPAPEMPVVVAPVRVVPPPPPGEVGAVRDVGRLLRHGEAFGKHRIEIRMLPTPVVITSGRIAVGDPLTPAQGRVLARQTAPGKYRVMLSIAHVDGEQRVAAAVMHAGRPPIARWVFAHFENQKPPRSADQGPGFSVDAGVSAFMDALALDVLRGDPDDPASHHAMLGQLLADQQQGVASTDHVVDGETGRNVIVFPSGWGAGTYSAYWALDGAGQPVCLVIDFDVFNKADWKSKSTVRR